ncbi:hypothetical protein DFQ26_007891 [Actinomortierella ambigua]|nr:hypothetical protein DFQ26_007891 [Actinomortierella ambigua]
MSLSVGSSIGAGAYGSVYNAYWEGRKVAIKQFAMTRADANRESAIQQEVQLLDSLRDKHIIQFYGTTEHEGRLVLVMEYAEGGSLEAAIQHRRLDWPTKTRIAQEVVRGLNYIHHKNVLHRDLKSMNVLLTRHMEVKLCDFGLATVKVRSASRSTSSSKGTLRWMAPELFAARPKYSTKSDMFALGVVMWELAANCTTPFQEQLDNFMVVNLVKNGEREELPDDTPPDYRRWVERCWDQDPTKRPEASEMVTKDDEPDRDVVISGGGGTTLALSLCMSDISPSSGSTVTPNSGVTYGSSYNAHSSWPKAMAGDSGAQMTVVVNEKATSVWSPTVQASRHLAEAQMPPAANYDQSTGIGQSDEEVLLGLLQKVNYSGSPEDNEALFRSGLWIMEGRGTAKNEAIGVGNIKMAAEAGHPGAQNHFAWACENGIGVDRDLGMAISWYRKSADQGNTEAKENLRRLSRRA